MMEPLVEALVVLSMAYNTWFVISVFQKRCFVNSFEFLMHLTAFDVFHYCHSASFKIVSHWLLSNPHFDQYNTTWLKANQFLGYVISFLPLYAILGFVAKEICLPNRKSERTRTKSEFNSALKRHQVYLWILAIFTAFPILCLSRQVEQFGSNLPIYDNSYYSQRHGNVVEIETSSYPSASFGILSVLPSSQSSLVASWRLFFECLSNPLWFPLACLCLLPIVAFFLLKKETTRREDEEDEEAKSPMGDANFIERFDSFQHQRHLASKHRLFACIFVLYYSIFIYDLFAFGKTFDEAAGGYEREDKFEFSHSLVRPHDGSLEVIYVFHHWTRPFATIMRNAFVALCWKMEDRLRVMNV